jgi:hypothetical protein
MRKPTISFAPSTDGDRLLTAIIDPQICLMLHDGEKCKLDLAVGLSQCQIAAGEGRQQAHHPRLWHGARGGFQHSEHANLAVCVRPGRSCRFTASLSETDAPENR